MINHGDDTFAMGLTSMSTLTNIEEYTSVMEPMDTMTDTEDPFVMGRTWLVLAVLELIVGLGVYSYLS